MSGETLRRDRRGRGVEGATRVEEGGEERPLVLLHRIGKGRGRCAIVYARVPPYRTHRIHSRIPTTYTRSQLNETCWRDAWYTHRNALVFLLLANPLPDPSLCFFVRAKIINGEGPGSLRPTPGVSVPWQWRSLHLGPTSSPRPKIVCYTRRPSLCLVFVLVRLYQPFQTRCLNAIAYVWIHWG